jgi:outer membrane protein OmpA-like peptidoglycan-associated protein
MKRYPIYMLLALLFALQTLPLLVNGQSTVGNEEYDHHSYQEAIRKYKIAVAKNPDDGELLFRLADSYRRLGQMREAERWFEQTLQHSDNSRAHLYYAQALLSNRKYAAAKEAFVHYARLAESETDANHAQMIAIACEKLATNGTVPSGIKVQKADFNSDQLDFSPVIWKENSIVFASNRPTARTADEASDPWTEAPFVDLWVVDVAANGKTGEPRPFAKEINSQFHEGPIVFNTSGDRVYLTRSDVAGKGHRGFDDKKNTRLKIYSATRIEDKWVMEPELSINSSKFSTCHPALSLTEDTLVFSSDRPGGYGGMDLWFAVKEGKDWSSPSNLGPEVNTAGNEVFPTMDAKGTLYFSTDFMVGYGGLDIFRTSKQGQEWGSPENLGAPINSSLDDYGLIVAKDHLHGHFSSNRSGSGDDIYSYLDMAKLAIPVLVLDCETGHPLSDVDVLVEGAENLVVHVDAHGEAQIPVKAGRDYQLSAYGTDYFGSGKCENTAKVHIPSKGNELLPAVVLRLSRNNPCCFKLQDPDHEGNKLFRYQWVMGDGASVPGRNTDYCYSQDGNYQVSLEIVDEDLNANITKYQTSIMVSGCGTKTAAPLVIEGTVRDRQLGIPLPFAEISIVDKCTGKTVNQRSDSSGHYRFVLTGKNDCDLWLMGKQQGYLPENIALNVKGRSGIDPLRQDMDLGREGFAQNNGFQQPAAGASYPSFGPSLPALPQGYIYVMPINVAAMQQPGGRMTEDMFSKPIEKGDVIELYNIYFDFGMYAIRDDAETDLEFLLQLLRKYPHMQGEISAHTDSRSSFEFNMHLSRQRAHAALDWLVARGVDPQRLGATGHGEYQLRNQCEDDVYCTELEHQRNRRVEFRVTHFDGVINSKEYEQFLPRIWNAFQDN